MPLDVGEEESRPGITHRIIWRETHRVTTIPYQTAMSEPGDPGSDRGSDRTRFEPTTAGEFHDALGTLLARAERNGVDVEGGWAFRDDDRTGRGVEIHRVVGPPDGPTAGKR